jgi:multiple sugar transport system substrate-binding protein
MDQTLFSAFTAANPDVKPEAVALPETGDVVAQIKSGELKVDAIVAPANSFLFNQGVVEPLDDLVKQENLSLAEYGNAIELARHNGKLYGLPVSVSPMLVVYNKELFDTAGLKHPAPGWTWDEFETAAKALAKAQEGNDPGYGVAVAPWTAADLLLSAGKGPADPDLTALTDTLNRLTRLHSDAKVAPKEVLGDAELDYYQAFGRGELGMLVSYWQNSFAHTKPEFAWGVAPLPGNDSTPGMGTLGMVTANAENRANAVAFIKFIASATGSQTIVTLPGAPVPAFVNDATQQQWLAHTALGQAGSFVFQLKYLPAPVYPADMATMLLTEADAALKGTKSVDDAIKAYKEARAPLMSNK